MQYGYQFLKDIVYIYPMMISISFVGYVKYGYSQYKIIIWNKKKYKTIILKKVIWNFQKLQQKYNWFSFFNSGRMWIRYDYEHKNENIIDNHF